MSKIFKLGIVVLTNMDGISGGEVHVRNLLESFKKINVQFDVFSSKIESFQFTIRIINFIKKIIGRLYLLIKIICKKYNYNGFYVRDWVFAYFLSFFSIQYYFEVNGLLLYEGLIRGHVRPFLLNKRFLIRIERRVCQHAQKIICVSKGMKDYIIKKYNIDPSLILFASNAANIDIYDPSKRKKKLPIDANTFVLCWMGGFQPYHGIYDLVEVTELMKRDSVTGIKFLIIGDGPGKNDIMQKINHSSLSHYFHFTGFVPWIDAPSYLQLANVCLSLDTRTLNNLEYRDIIGVTTIKVFEYLAMGKPVIAHDLGNAKSFFEGQRIGWVTETKTSKLYQKIIKVKNSPHQVREYSINARKITQKKYNWDATATKIISFISQ